MKEKEGGGEGGEKEGEGRRRKMREDERKRQGRGGELGAVSWAQQGWESFRVWCPGIPTEPCGRAVPPRRSL